MIAQTDAELMKLIEEDQGLTSMELMEQCTLDSVCPAICRDCKFVVTEMEPDQTMGWCESCHSNNVVSYLVLAGMI